MSSQKQISCPYTARYIDVKSAKLVQIMLDISTKFHKKTNFRGGGCRVKHKIQLTGTLDYLQGEIEIEAGGGIFIIVHLIKERRFHLI